MWVYKFDGSRFHVGYYDPAGKWTGDNRNTHSDVNSASERVSYLNGSPFRPNDERELEVVRADSPEKMCELINELSCVVDVQLYGKIFKDYNDEGRLIYYQIVWKESRR